MLSKVQYIGDKKIIKPGQGSYLALIALLVAFLFIAFIFYLLGVAYEELMSIMNFIIGSIGVLFLIVALDITYNAGYTVEVEGEQLIQIYRIFGKVVYQRTLSLKNGYKFEVVDVHRGGRVIYLIIDERSVFIASSRLVDDVNVDKALLRSILGKDELNQDTVSDEDDDTEYTWKDTLKAIFLLIVLGLGFAAFVLLMALGGVIILTK